MRTIFLGALAAALLTAGAASAQSVTATETLTPPEHTVGVGLVLNQGLQVTTLWRLSAVSDLDIRLNLSALEDRMLAVSGAYLVDVVEFGDPGLSLPLYVGVGLQVGADTSSQRRDAALAIEGIAGLSLELVDIPVEAFAELEPRVRLSDPVLPVPALALAFGLGLRFKF
jgi:hypothetical protein